MRVLSGDHWMSPTPPLTSLTFCASPPARLSSQICPPFFFSSSVPREATKARYLLSGLQRGDDSPYRAFGIPQLGLVTLWVESGRRTQDDAYVDDLFQLQMREQLMVIVGEQRKQNRL